MWQETIQRPKGLVDIYKSKGLVVICTQKELNISHFAQLFFALPALLTRSIWLPMQCSLLNKKIWQWRESPWLSKNDRRYCIPCLTRLGPRTVKLTPFPVENGDLGSIHISTSPKSHEFQWKHYIDATLHSNRIKIDTKSSTQPPFLSRTNLNRCH